MFNSPSPALRLLVTKTAIFIRRYAAEVLRVLVGDLSVATDAGGQVACTNVTAHVVTLIVGTLHVVVTDDLTLAGGFGGTVGTLVVTLL